ncbi:MAG: hypothetical protein PVI30_26500 [Myxococcales bacterium]|jgi:hypothetical protein
MTRARFTPLLLLALLGGGCDEDLPKATSIERMRVLGVELEVVGDAPRATPRPGESVRASFPTVFPDLEAEGDDLSTMLIRCTAPTRYTGGIPICQEFLDAALGQGADIAAVLDMQNLDQDRFRCSDLPVPQITLEGVTVACLQGPPSVELPIPDDYARDAALFLGVVCEEGDPYISPTEPTLFGCEGAGEEAEVIPINGLIPVQLDDAAENRNPDLDALALYVDLPRNIPSDEAPLENYPDWPAFDGEPSALPPRDNCAAQARQLDDDPLRFLSAGSHELRLRLDPGVREAGEDGDLETLEITVYTSWGEMERRFTLFNQESPLRNDAFDDTVEWTPPDDGDVSQGGRLLRFFITLRDGRGGFDMRTFVGCYGP